MIKKISKFLSKITKKEESKVKCFIDDTEVPIHECGPDHLTQGYECLENVENYVGVPAPKVLEDDPWFGKAPKSDKQNDYEEKVAIESQIEEDQRKEETQGFQESENIHQVMYEIATKNWNTVDETKQSMGGSENFQEGWNSGTGMGQYR